MQGEIELQGIQEAGRVAEKRAMPARELVMAAIALREARKEIYDELRLVEGIIIERMAQMNTVALPVADYDVRLEPRDWSYDMDALTGGLRGLVTDEELRGISITKTSVVVDGRALRSLATKYKGDVAAVIEASRKASGNTLTIKPTKKKEGIA